MKKLLLSILMLTVMTSFIACTQDKFGFNDGVIDNIPADDNVNEIPYDDDFGTDTNSSASDTQDTVTETACHDGTDDDQDGAIDCDDSDCSADTQCKVTETFPYDYDPNNPDTPIRFIKTTGSDLAADGISNNTSCSSEEPCATADHVLTNVAAEGDIIAFFEGEYVFSSDMVIDKNITINGGFYTNADGLITADPANHPSSLVFPKASTWMPYKILITGGSKPTLEGLTLWGSHMGVLQIKDAGPTIKNNSIKTYIGAILNFVVAVTNSGPDTYDVVFEGNEIRSGGSLLIGTNSLTLPFAVSNLDTGTLNLTMKDNQIISGDLLNFNATSTKKSFYINLMAFNKPASTGQLNLDLDNNDSIVGSSHFSMNAFALNVNKLNADNNIFYTASPISYLAFNMVVSGNTAVTPTAELYSNVFSVDIPNNQLPTHLLTAGLLARDLHVHIHNNTFLQKNTVIGLGVGLEQFAATSSLTMSNNAIINAGLIVNSLWIRGGTASEVGDFNNNYFSNSSPYPSLTYFISDPTPTFFKTADALAAPADLDAAFSGSGSIVNDTWSLVNLTTDYTGDIYKILHSSDSAPLIDKGLNTSVPEGDPKDAFGNPRVVDTVDIGAVEYQK